VWERIWFATRRVKNWESWGGHRGGRIVAIGLGCYTGDLVERYVRLHSTDAAVVGEVQTDVAVGDR
jgi:hypothetical protein